MVDSVTRRLFHAHTFALIGYESDVTTCDVLLSKSGGQPGAFIVPDDSCTLHGLRTLRARREPCQDESWLHLLQRLSSVCELARA